MERNINETNKRKTFKLKRDFFKFDIIFGFEYGLVLLAINFLDWFPKEAPKLSNTYQLIFTNNYQNGNVEILLSVISCVFVFLFSELIGFCKIKRKVYYDLRLAFSYSGVLYTIIIASAIPSITSVIMPIIYFAVSLLLTFLKVANYKERKYNRMFTLFIDDDCHNKLFLSTLMISFALSIGFRLVIWDPAALELMIILFVVALIGLTLLYMLTPLETVFQCFIPIFVIVLDILLLLITIKLSPIYILFIIEDIIVLTVFIIMSVYISKNKVTIY